MQAFYISETLIPNTRDYLAGLIPGKVEGSNGSYSLQLVRIKNKLIKFMPRKLCFGVVNCKEFKLFYLFL